MTFADAQRVADAVLYEGYLLYPYRASAVKNQVRWQFGVLMPRSFAEADGSERWQMRTECLVRPEADAGFDFRIRFLRIQVRALEALDGDGNVMPTDELEVDGERLMAWEEATEETVDVSGVPLAELAGSGRDVPFDLDPKQSSEDVLDGAGTVRGRILRSQQRVSGRVSLSAVDAGDGLSRVRIVVENSTAGEGGDGRRDTALRGAMLGVHTLLSVENGKFISLLEPPAEATAAVAGCDNDGTWPVLMGEDGRVMLSSPIILYDQPAIAPESPGDLFDATEIDEILTLRIMTLTDEEKREARATDPRARQIIDRSDAMPPEMMERLHGAVRQVMPKKSFDEAVNPQLGGMPSFEDSIPTFGDAMPQLADEAPVWEPNARVAPELATTLVGDREISKGSRVRLVPGPRGDSMDMFLRGRTARVEGVFESVDDEVYVAVTLEDDPAAELHAWYGRYFYYRPTELEAVDELTEASR
ncbi:MAG: hypothetical protein ABIW50_08395 [Candidatus Limnocylindria bacterium]